METETLPVNNREPFAEEIQQNQLSHEDVMWWVRGDGFSPFPHTGCEELPQSTTVPEGVWQRGSGVRRESNQKHVDPNNTDDRVNTAEAIDLHYQPTNPHNPAPTHQYQLTSA